MIKVGSIVIDKVLLDLLTGLGVEECRLNEHSALKVNSIVNLADNSYININGLWYSQEEFDEKFFILS